jgi:hypothetical protein
MEVSANVEGLNKNLKIGLNCHFQKQNLKNPLNSFLFCFNIADLKEIISLFVGFVFSKLPLCQIRFILLKHLYARANDIVRKQFFLHSRNLITGKSRTSRRK